MTKEKLRRYFELESELEERGRLDSTASPTTPRWDEYCRLKEEFDAWEPESEIGWVPNDDDCVTCYSCCRPELWGKATGWTRIVRSPVNTLFVCDREPCQAWVRGQIDRLRTP